MCFRELRRLHVSCFNASRLRCTKGGYERFENRIVIVTGGARGMGASHARGFVAEGADVVIADVLDQEGQSLADELSDHAIFSHLDVTSETDWAATVTAAEMAFGRDERNKAPSNTGEST
jgi:NAD(P)-dependent dehydrogenase (short-subunit alcohol dehydrogenase family)